MDSQNLMDILSRATELTDLSRSRVTTSSGPPSAAPVGFRHHAPAGSSLVHRHCSSQSQRRSALPVPVMSAAGPRRPAHAAAGGPIKPLPVKAGKSLTKPTAGASAAKKRTWKKPADKPKRPLSAYNLFFQSERAAIVEAKDREIALAERKAAGIGSISPAADKPQSPAGAARARGGKRAHRRTHGKIGFAALAQNIAAKWKTLDEATKAPFEKKALAEKERYKKEIEIWERKRKAKKELEEAEGGKQQSDGGDEKCVEDWQQQQQQQQKPKVAKATPAAKPAPVPTPSAKKAPTPPMAQRKRKLERPSSMAPPPPSSVSSSAHPLRTVSISEESAAMPAAANFEPLSLRTMLARSHVRQHHLQQQQQQQPQLQQRTQLPLHHAAVSASVAFPSNVPSMAIAVPRTPHQVTPPLPAIIPPSPVSIPAPKSQPLSLSSTCAPHLKHLDDFEMNIDAIFGSEGAALPEPVSIPSYDGNGGGAGVDDVMSSLDKMSNDLDGEFVDFMTMFDE